MNVPFIVRKRMCGRCYLGIIRQILLGVGGRHVSNIAGFRPDATRLINPHASRVEGQRWELSHRTNGVIS